LYKSSFLGSTLDKDRLIDFQNELTGPCVIPVVLKILTSSSTNGLRPLEVVKLLEREGTRSYLLESTSKIPNIENSTYSFVGYNPGARVTGDIASNSVEIEFFDDSLKEMLTRSIRDAGDISLGEKVTLKVKDGLNIFDALRKCVQFAEYQDPDGLIRTICERQLFTGGAVGYISYDAVKELQIRTPTNDVRGHAFEFYIIKDVLVFDHSDDSLYAISNLLLDRTSNVDELIEDLTNKVYQLNYYLSQSSGAADLQYFDKQPLFSQHALSASMTKEKFERATTEAIEHIYAGNIFQIVLSIRHETEIRCAYQGGSPHNLTTDEKLHFERTLYEELRRLNPSPYMYFLRFGDVSIIGSSPETLFSVCSNKLFTNPIAGTCPRGSDDSEDVTFANSMLNDPKERAEHLMLVDLGRNDVRSVCEGGSVEVIDEMSVVKYSHVQHIESTVAGTLRDDYDAFSAAQAVMPMGTVSGAPKIRAMELIDTYEPVARGIYGGGVGYFAFNGDSDFAIAIRTFIIEGTMVSYQAGAGIVADSVPRREFEEVKRKLAALETALYNVTSPVE
jgi:anthranilate synthase component 1